MIFDEPIPISLKEYVRFICKMGSEYDAVLTDVEINSEEVRKTRKYVKERRDNDMAVIEALRYDLEAAFQPEKAFMAYVWRDLIIIDQACLKVLSLLPTAGEAIAVSRELEIGNKIFREALKRLEEKDEMRIMKMEERMRRTWAENHPDEPCPF